jgi:hypothetical protein
MSSSNGHGMEDMLQHVNSSDMSRMIECSQQWRKKSTGIDFVIRVTIFIMTHSYG